MVEDVCITVLAAFMGGVMGALMIKFLSLL